MFGARDKPQRWDDAPLVQRASEGDGRAWAQLVDRYAAYVQALLKSCRVPDSDIADSFQHVFVELFEALPRLKATNYLAPWLRQTAIRYGIRTREKLGRTAQLPEDLESLISEDSVSVEMERAETVRLVGEAVAGLPPACRDLVTRLFFEDPPRPYAEVAAELGIKVGSMGMTRKRCLDSLEKLLRARGLP